MVKLKGPMFSHQASGSLAKTLTLSTWKGRAYAKKISMPTNNQQASQLGVRATMKFLSQQWSGLDPAEKTTWDELAAALNVSAFNAYVSINQKRFADGLAFTKEYPAAEAAYSDFFIIFAGVDKGRFIELSIGESTPGAGWSGFLYRSSATGFTALPSNCIQTFPLVHPTGTYILTDTPPTSGTWYYRARGSNDSGTFGSASAQRAVVFTA